MESTLGRDRELHALIRALEGPGPGLVLLRGARQIGKSHLLRAAVTHLARRSRSPGREDPDLDGPLFHAFAPLPAPDQRARLAESARRAGRLPTDGLDALSPTRSWSGLFDALRGPDEAWATGARRPRVIVLDDVHHLLAHGTSVAEALVELWHRLRARALPVHLVLSGSDPELSARWAELPEEIRVAPTLELSLGGLTFRDVADRLDGWEPRDRARAWAIFGGQPAHVRTLDPAASLATNLRKAFLEPGAPLARSGLEMAERHLHSPARYLSLLRVLAGGARDWGAIREAADDFESGSQIAPYLARLEELGLVQVDRSLDAAPGGRRRRYHLADPSLGFWWRFVLPAWSEIQAGRGGEVWGGGLPPCLDEHVAACFHRLCRWWLLEHGDEVFPVAGREVGGLWGAGYDLDVSGTLRNGAVVYGRAIWTDEPVVPDRFDAVDEEVRNTRYGFGREARLRVLFTSGPVEPDTRRRAAREIGLRFVELRTIVSGTVDARPGTGR